MADTIRPKATLLTELFQDNQAPGSITPQDLRDLIVSLAALVHTHEIADVNGLVTALANKANVADYNGLYVWRAYADSNDGTLNFSFQPGTRSYLGIAVNKAVANPSTDPTQYSWLRVKGSDGTAGTQGLPGTNGVDGLTYYQWIAYADSADGGLNFSNSVPGGRTFIGIANNKLTQTESTNPSDYTWSQYVGPATFGLLARGQCYVSGTTITKRGGANAWDSDCYSTETWRNGAYCTFQAGQTNCSIMAGLNTDPTTDQNFTSLDYCWYLNPAGTALIYESGSSTSGVSIPYTTASVFAVQYDGQKVSYLIDGVVARTVPVASGLGLFFDTSFATPGGKLVRVSFAPMGSAGTNGINGTNGVNGVNAYPLVARSDSLTNGFITLTGDTLTRTAAGTHADNYVGAYSRDAYPSGMVAIFSLFAPDTTFCSAGLNHDPAAVGNLAGIDASWILYWRNGVSYAQAAVDGGVIGGVAQVSANTRYQVQYRHNGAQWVYRFLIQNYVGAPDGSWRLQVESAAPANQTLYFDALVPYTNASVTAWTFGPLSSDGTDGIPGASSYQWVAYANNATGTLDFTTSDRTANGIERGFQGLAVNMPTPTESLNPADYQWSPYVGPPGFGVVTYGTAAVVGSHFAKYSGSSAADSGVYTDRGWSGGAFIGARITAGQEGAIALDIQPSTRPDTGAAEYVLVWQRTGTLLVLNNFNTVGAPQPAWALGDTVDIRNDNATIRYIHNGVTFFSQPAPSESTVLYGHWGMASPMAMDGCVAGALGAKGDIGAAGPQGLPGGNPASVFLAQNVALVTEGDDGFQLTFQIDPAFTNITVTAAGTLGAADTTSGVHNFGTVTSGQVLYTGSTRPLYSAGGTGRTRAVVGIVLTAMQNGSSAGTVKVAYVYYYPNLS